MSKSAGEISIKLDMESGKMQRQLRAIAKHTEALADELRGIDEEVCPKCGGINLEVMEPLLGGTTIKLPFNCYDCGHSTPGVADATNG